MARGEGKFEGYIFSKKNMEMATKKKKRVTFGVDLNI